MKNELPFADLSVGETFAFVLVSGDVGWPCQKVSATQYEFTDPPDGDTTIYTADSSQLVSQDV